jgi:hypothetical protein
MPQDLTILTSRRAYEFRPDDIRLTMLTLPVIQQALTATFNFQNVGVGTPQPTFGDVPVTVPPGWAGDLGMMAAEDGQPIPVRFIHFEPRRIVIDIGAPSHFLDRAYELVREVTDVYQAPDGRPVLGNPVAIKDYSEVTARLDLDPLSLFPAPLVELLRKTMNAPVDRSDSTLVPTIYVSSASNTAEFPGSVRPDSTVLQLSLRLGSRPGALMYFSGAPVESDLHLTYLNDLESTMRSVSSREL